MSYFVQLRKSLKIVQINLEPPYLISQGMCECSHAQPGQNLNGKSHLFAIVIELWHIPSSGICCSSELHESVFYPGESIAVRSVFQNICIKIVHLRVNKYCFKMERQIITNRQNQKLTTITTFFEAHSFDLFEL